MRAIVGVAVAAIGFVACAPATTELSTEAPAPATTTAVARPTTTTTVPPVTTTVPPVTTTTEPPPPPVPVAPPPPIPEPTSVLENPPPEITPVSGSVQDMICAKFGPQCSKALSVVQCESNFNPGVVGAAGERGLFQIHPVHIQYLAPFGGWDAMFDPAANINYAYDLFSRAGWGPWTCA